MTAWWLLKEEKQQGSYRSGGIALIDGVFEVCAELIKGNDLQNNVHMWGKKMMLVST